MQLALGELSGKALEFSPCASCPATMSGVTVAEGEGEQESESGRPAAPGRLARLAGAAPDDLRAGTTEASSFRLLGVLLLSLAFACGVLLALVSIVVLKSGMLVGVGVGAFVFVVVLIVNAILVPNAAVPRTTARSVLAAIPGFVIATGIGVLVAAALTALFFRSEIDDQLAASRIAVASAPFADLPSRQQTVAMLKTQIEHPPPFDPALIPEVRDLRADFAKIDAQFNSAENGLICERGGSCEPGDEPGPGPAYGERKMKYDRIDRDRTDIQQKLKAAEQGARASYDAMLSANRMDLVTQQAGLDGEHKALETAVERARNADVAESPLSRFAAIVPVAQARGGVWGVLAVLLLLYVGLHTLPLVVGLVRSRPDDPVRTRRAAADTQIDELHREYAARRDHLKSEYEKKVKADRADLEKANDALRRKQKDLLDEIQRWERRRDRAQADYQESAARLALAAEPDGRDGEADP